MITGRKSGQNLQQKRENLGDDLFARIFHRQLLFLPARFDGALLFRPQRLQQLLQNSGRFSDHNCSGIYWVKNYCDHINANIFRTKALKTRFDCGNTWAKAQKIKVTALSLQAVTRQFQSVAKLWKCCCCQVPADIMLSPMLSLTSFSKSTTTYLHPSESH